MAIVSALVSWLKLLEGAKNGSKSFPATMRFVNARACYELKHKHLRSCACMCLSGCLRMCMRMCVRKKIMKTFF